MAGPTSEKWNTSKESESGLEVGEEKYLDAWQDQQAESESEIQAKKVKVEIWVGSWWKRLGCIGEPTSGKWNTSKENVEANLQS